jgi:hypothetical protein
MLDVMDPATKQFVQKCQIEITAASSSIFSTCVAFPVDSVISCMQSHESGRLRVLALDTCNSQKSWKRLLCYSGRLAGSSLELALGVDIAMGSATVWSHYFVVATLPMHVAEYRKEVGTGREGLARPACRRT